MVKSIMALAVALLLVTGEPVNAHPLHTSFTEIVKDARTGHIAVSVRLFSDDFQAALDSIAALSSSAGASREAIARRYFERSVSIQHRSGNQIGLSWCGMRTKDGLTWLCARSTAPVPNGRLLIRNALMFDRFTDHISIVRWTAASGTRTVVLSARAREAVVD